MYEVPVVFPESIPHNTFREMNPVAAGFVNFYGSETPIDDAICAENGIKVWAGGVGTSLGLGSRPCDTELIKKEFLRHYF